MNAPRKRASRAPAQSSAPVTVPASNATEPAALAVPAASDGSDNSGRLYGGASPEDRAQRRREQFLDAGLQLIGTEGYRGASVRALCRQAKLTDRYFYESFQTVEDVLIAVYQRENARLTAAVLAALPAVETGMSVSDVARPALRAFFEVARQPLVARIVWFEVLGVSDRVNRIYRDTISAYGQTLLGIIRSLYPLRSLRPELESLMAMAIVGAISQTTMAWIVSGFATSIDDLVEVATLLLEGLVLRLDLKLT